MKPVKPGFIHPSGEDQSARKRGTRSLTIAARQWFEKLRESSWSQKRSALYRVPEGIRYERWIFPRLYKVSDRALDRHRRKSVDVDDIFLFKPPYA